MTRLTGCDTFVVLGSHTEQGGIVFGKNSDRPAGEPQEIVHFPASKHDPGSKLTVNWRICCHKNSIIVLLNSIRWFLHKINFWPNSENENDLLGLKDNINLHWKHFSGNLHRNRPSGEHLGSDT